MNIKRIDTMLSAPGRYFFENIKDDLYRLAVEGTNDGLWYYHLSNDLLYLSPHALKVLGYEPDRVITGEEARNSIIDKGNYLDVEKKMKSLIDGESFSYDEEFKVATSQGGVIWLRVRGKLISRNEKGIVDGIGGTFEDVTLRRKSEEELLKTRREFRSYFDSASVGMSVNAPDKFWLEVNQELCRIFGYSKDELMQKTWIELTHPDDLEISLKFYQMAMDGKLDNYKLDKRFIRKDGSIAYISLSICSQRKDDGSIDYFIGSYVDNTERHSIEAREKERFRLLRTLIDNLPSKIYVLDKEGKKVIANIADVLDSGYKSENEILGKTQLELFPDLYGESDHAENLRILGSGLGVFNREKVVPEINGVKKLIQVSKIPLVDQRNQIYGLIGFEHDITAVKEMEHRIRESEEYFRTLIEVAPYGIVISDINGFPTFISQKAREVFRIPENSDLSKLWVFGFVAPEYREEALVNFNETIAGKRKIKADEYKCLTFENEAVWMEVIASPIYEDSQNITGIIIMCHDISVRKKAEKELLVAKHNAEQGDKFKTSLIRNISHEIRTPLNAILGFSDLITDPRISAAEKSEYLEIMNASSDQLLNTIDNLVDISTIEARTTRVVINEIDLNEIFNGIYNLFHKKAVIKNIRIRIRESKQSEKIMIKSDRMRLFQILSHLVSNAIKFTWYGEVTIGYTLKNGMIEFFVTDTGIGIPAEFHSKVFENFFQIDDCNRKIDGIGLGLPICKAYVELLGGKIWLSSESGRGSSFYFTIPYDLNEENSPSEREALETTAKKYKILVVDDLETNRRYLEDMFRLENIEVRSAENGMEAIEICKSDIGISVVLMDLKMPVMGGIEAVANIKAIRPSLLLIAQSAYLSEKSLALSAGFDYFISKPFTRQQIMLTINRHLNSSNK